MRQRMNREQQRLVEQDAIYRWGTRVFWFAIGGVYGLLGLRLVGLL